MTTVKEGGTGVNTCVSKTHSVCDIVRIPVSNVLKVLPMINEEALLSGLVDPAPNINQGDVESN